MVYEYDTGTWELDGKRGTEHTPEAEFRPRRYGRPRQEKRSTDSLQTSLSLSLSLPSYDTPRLTRTRLFGRFLLWLPNAISAQSFLDIRNSAEIESSIGLESFFLENMTASGDLRRYCRRGGGGGREKEVHIGMMRWRGGRGKKSISMVGWRNTRRLQRKRKLVTLRVQLQSEHELHRLLLACNAQAQTKHLRKRNSQKRSVMYLRVTLSHRLLIFARMYEYCIRVARLAFP